MTIAQSLIAFFVAAGLLAITPGVDTAMVLRTSTVEGPRRAIAAALGIVLGCLTWGAAVAVGVGALIATSPVAFSVLKWAGAIYLAVLGLRLLLRPRSTALGDDVNAPASSTESAADGAFVWLRRGLVTNLLNPKVGVFYVTFLPQFVPPEVAVGPWTFLLAAIHGALGLAWFALLIAASVPLRRVLARPVVVKALDRVTGAVFVAFGVKLALSR